MSSKKYERILDQVRDLSIDEQLSLMQAILGEMRTHDLPPAASPDRFSLTEGQYLMWLGQQFFPDDPIYVQVNTFTIRGALDLERFMDAFEALVQSHEVLRTVIISDDDKPYQEIRQAESQLELLDLSDHADPESAYQEWLAERKMRPFQLHERLYDSVLVTLDDDTVVWYLNLHHVITDNVSVQLLYRRLADYYELALDNRLQEREEPPQYADFVRIERAARDGEEFREAKAYWKEKLQAPLAPTAFYDEAPVEAGVASERLIVELGAERSVRLRQLARQGSFASASNDLSLFTVFATLLLTTLYRIGGANRMRLGSPFSVRQTADMREMVGLLIEMIALQLEFDHDDTFQSVGAKLMGDVFETLPHIQPGIGSAEMNRSYDVVLNFLQGGFMDFAGLPMQQDLLFTETIDADHSLRLWITDFDLSGNFVLYFDMKTAVIDARDRARFVQHFLAVMDAFLTDPQQSIGAFSLMTREEREQLFVAFNNSDAAYPSQKTVVALFEEQVSASPQATAAVDGDEAITYAQLNARANRLARYLMAKGVGPEQRVALCLDRSIDALVAIWGTLKAGAAYVPIDVMYPLARITAMLDDAEPVMVLVDNADLQSALQQSAATPVLDLKGLSLSEYGDANPPTLAAPEDLVYMIYTSGSTGRPKGTMLTHRGLMNYVWWARRVYQDGQSLDWPLYSSLSFDLTVTSTFVPLISGGKVVIYGASEEAPGLEILSVFADDAVDIVKLTPAHLNLLRGQDLQHARIRTLIVGGEDFKTELAHAVTQQFAGQVRIYNEYGPTEAVVGCMIHRYNPAHDTAASVPIGRPAANARIYLLDKYEQPVPPGVIGEMVISSDGVARGYFNRPQLTAERFGLDPFRDGARIYRTGDIARWNDDGQMVFLGRRDQQVKIRGARIELGEVESALAAHPQVESAVVEVFSQREVSEEVDHCMRCGLPESYPEADFDDQGICADCRAFERHKDDIARYFGEEEDLRRKLEAIKERKADERYDSMVLLSGGKDSTYMLYQLVKNYGLRPLVFSLDNGYISEQAIANIRNICDDLGVDLELATTPHMNAILADSLRRHSNVCDGCYKTIYTLSIKLAHELNIDTIITGLARGQLFETRLSDTFRAGCFDPGEIDSWIAEARRAYHQIEDATTQLLDVRIFADDRIFDDVQMLDFYRYVDVDLDEVYLYLQQETVWQRPSDTGRSTNCLINDAGIYIHNKERGYHNYALPYSWDVRLGHKTRELAMHELDDDLDIANVRRMLAKVGYDENEKAAQREEKRLAAYYVTDGALSASDLRAYLTDRLPSYMIPSTFTELEEMPLTANGKVDRSALPDPETGRAALETTYAAPTTENERLLVEIWSNVFRLPDIGIHDNFFDLGGDSIISIQVVSQARQAGIQMAPRDIFQRPTIAELSAAVSAIVPPSSSVEEVSGDVPLTPIQHRFFNLEFAEPDQWNQSLWLTVPADIDAQILKAALQQLPRRHEALRLRYIREGSVHRQVVQDNNNEHIRFFQHDLAAQTDAMRERTLQDVAAELEASMNIEAGPLMQAALFRLGDRTRARLFLVLHHLVVDGISWRILLEDLQLAYENLRRGEQPQWPPKSVSFPSYVNALLQWADSPEVTSSLSYWRKLPLTVNLPSPEGAEPVTAARTISTKLSVEETRALLQDVPGVYRTSINDALLSAAALAFAEVLGTSRFVTMLEGHGREEELLPGHPDLTRTVGWFTSQYPVSLHCDPESGPGAALQAVKAQLDEVPHHGLSYGVLRYLRRDPSLAEQETPDIVFNYLGQFERSLPFSDLLQPFGGLRLQNDYSGRNKRPFALEINAFVQDEQLHFEWTIAPDRVDIYTAEKLALTLGEKLQAIIAHCSEKDENGTGNGEPDLGRHSQDGLLPLSHMQQRLYFLQQLYPHSSAYHMYEVWRVHGRVDAEALGQALNAVSQRQATLRTTFTLIDGQPWQLVSEKNETQLAVTDLSAVSPGKQDQQLRQLIDEQLDRPFDLSAAPPARFALIRLREDEQVLVIVMHHILGDEWSNDIFWRELNEAYAEVLNGRQVALHELPIQYSDFAVWLRGRVQSGALEHQLQYWKDQLAGELPLIQLPFDRPRERQQSLEGGLIRRTLQPDLLAALKRLSRELGTTPYMTLLAAYFVLLYRYGNEEEILVGTPVANRQRPETKDVMGMFINTAVIRTRLTGAESFAEAVSQVTDIFLEALANLDLPFDEVVQALDVPRDLGHNPLFQTMLVYVDPAMERTLPGTEFELVEVDPGVAKFDLTLFAGEENDRLACSVEYSSDLFDRVTAERILDHWQTMLTAALADPQATIDKLPLLTSEERSLTLQEWNDTSVELALQSIPDLITEQAANDPQAPAVIAYDGRLTYGELDVLANKLAHLLREQGVGSGTPVGLYADRSAAMLVGILGIHKAGGAYVPLDPSYPFARLAHILEDTSAPVVVAQAHRAPDLPQSEASVVKLDEAFSSLQGFSQEPPATTISLQDLAYIIYTSGSTGAPKGVMITHGNLLASTLARFDYYDLQPERYLLLSSFAFDSSVAGIFWTLAAGGALVLPAPEEEKDMQRLAQIVETEGVTHTLALPSLYQLLLDFAPQGRLDSLKVVVVAGETCPPDLGRQHYANLSQCKLYNEYGPTEATVWCTVFEIPPSQDGDLVPIGRPIANSNIYILDRRQQVVPIGLPGELYVGGAGISPGYWHDPQRTDHQFPTLSLTGRSQSERLYRTGDLARWRADGEIEFLGRIDGQVKVRGYRVELGEIEYVLDQHAAVDQCVVIVRDDAPQKKQMVAYYLSHAQRRPSAEDLQDYLRRLLPNYMIPGAFVALDAFPLLPNGKVDIRSLPQPDPSQTAVSHPFVPPRNATEETVAGMWADVLQVERVGLYDDFFSLGGHSLLAIRLVGRVREAFDVDLPLKTLFEDPTVAAMAAAVLSSEKERLWSDEFERIAADGMVAGATTPLSFAQERLWFLHQLDPGGHTLHLSRVWRIKGRLNVEALEAALREIQQRHIILRTVFPDEEGVPYASVTSGAQFALKIADFRDANATSNPFEDAAVHDYIAAEQTTPFDLSQGPLWRAALLSLADDDVLLSVVFHHITVDGESIPILLDELALIYESFLEEKRPPLPEMVWQYGDYARWQRKEAEAASMAEQLAHWREQLAGFETLQLPTDYPRPSIQTHRGAQEQLSLPVSLQEGIRRLSQQEGVTEFMFMLAALQLLLARIVGQEDIIVGSPIANRDIVATEGMIGCFLNNLALRTDLGGNPTFTALLRRVRKVALDAFANQNIPFEKLLVELQPERRLDQTPFFNVFINSLALSPIQHAVKGLHFETMPQLEIHSQFDLTLYVTQEGRYGDSMQPTTSLSLVYNVDLFNAESIREMLAQYVQLLEQLVEAPEQPIDAYSLVTPVAAEKLPNPRELLDTSWYGAVHERMSHFATSAPESTALVDMRGAWSYGRLEQAVNGLAARLLGDGIRRGDVVAIYANRRAEFVVALLGVLKAGAAFMVLNPDYPQQRLLTYLNIARPKGFINLHENDDELLRSWEAGHLLSQLNLYDLISLEEELRSVEFPVVGPDDLAFVAFTSGTTGEPKGIRGRHGSLTHFMPFQVEKLGLRADDRFSMLSAVNYDGLQREVFTSLWVGASLYIAQDDLIFSLGQLPLWLRENAITFAHMTPPMTQLLTLGNDDPVLLPDLRYVFSLGDRLTVATVHDLRMLAPQVTYLNTYGTTETQRAVSMNIVPPDLDLAGVHSVLPVGKGIPGAQLLIVNREGALAGIREVGEIWVRSPHLALGYLGDDALTAERFITNPLSGLSNDIVYRTGDLGRYMPDGSVYFLGRADRQVKIRGHRIEPAELEAVIQQHEAVESCVVTVHQRPDGSVSLIAFFVGPNDSGVKQDIADQVRTQLPAHMVPSAYVALDRLPLTPNGKIDYRALAEIEISVGVDVAYESPSTSLEETLAEIWADLLRVERVGLNDNFFDLGGHSLLGAVLFARIEERIGRKLSLNLLFQAPTVGQLARAIRDGQDEEQDPVLVTVQTGGDKPALFYVHGVYGDLGSLTYLLPRLEHDQPVYGFQALGLNPDLEPDGTIERIASRYIDIMRSVQPHGPYRVGGYCFGGVVAYEMARQLAELGQETDVVAVIEGSAPRQYHNFKPIYDPDRLRVIGETVPSWIRGYKAYGGWRIRERIGRRLGSGQGARSKVDNGATINVEFDNLADFNTVRPEIQYHLREIHLQALRDYQPKPFAGSVTFFRARYLRIGHALLGDIDPKRGWASLATGDVSIHYIDGTHTGIMQPPCVDELASAITNVLNQDAAPFDG